MSTTSLNHVPPPAATPAPILEHPNLQPAGAGGDPFLSILDAAATRAANHHADRGSTDAAARDDDDPLDDDEPVEEPQESPASATVAPVVVPVVQTGPNASQAATAQSVAAAVAGKQHVAPAAASSNGAAKSVADKSAADKATRATPSQAAAPAATQPDAERQSPSAGADDIDLQVAKQDVKSKPTTMLSAADTATAKPAQQLEPDLRAERYADLRTNPANRLAGGGEIRLADIGTPPADATKAQAPAANQQVTGHNTDVGRLMAAAASEAPAAQLVAAANASPVPNGNVPAAVGATVPGSPVSGTALTGAPAVDAASPAGAVTRDASLPDAARTAAAVRNQPATTARTVEQIAVQIKNGLNAGADKIHVRLQPAALGRVDIQLEVGHDQRVQAIVVVEKADTLEILERDARHLHRMLEDAGFHTDNDSLTFRQQTSPDQQQPGGQGANSPALTDAGEPGEQTTETEVRTSRHDGLLDVEV